MFKALLRNVPPESPPSEEDKTSESRSRAQPLPFRRPAASPSSKAPGSVAQAQQIPTGNPILDANPYRAHHTWPPDFTTLSDRYQFRLERRYRRRTKLKWARPRLMRWTKLGQWGISGAVLTYAVLFMDWQDDRAFVTARRKYHEVLVNLGLSPT